MKVLLIIGLVVTLGLSGGSLAGKPVPVFFDAHIHYSEDAWEPLPVKRALELLDEAGIERMLVSSTPTEGTVRLYSAAPDRVVPFLRPYPTRAHRYTWFRDEAIPAYIREQLKQLPYRGIGEFHVFGEDARSPVVAEVIAIARAQDLALHAHTDLAGMQALLEQAADIPVLWAHGGFDVPVSELRVLLNRYERLYVELSFREGITEAGRLTEAWRSLLTEHSDRFLMGMDSYQPIRWLELPALAAEARAWLKQLPGAVASAIAYRNAERLFGAAP